MGFPAKLKGIFSSIICTMKPDSASDTEQTFQPSETHYHINYVFDAEKAAHPSKYFSLTASLKKRARSALAPPPPALSNFIPAAASTEEFGEPDLEYLYHTIDTDGLGLEHGSQKRTAGVRVVIISFLFLLLTL